MAKKTADNGSEKKRKSTKRRGNGEGSIFQRAEGRWGAEIIIGYDASGKRKRRTVYGKTKKEVQEKLTRLLGRKLEGTLGEPCRLRVGQYLDRWLEDSARPTIRPSTYENYRTMVRLHVKPHVGGVLLTKLTAAHVQGMLSSMERGGLSPRMRQLAFVILRKSLTKAVKWNLLPRNVCDAVDAPKATKRPMQTLTLEQARRFLKAAEGERLYAMFVVAVWEGLRMGELMGLQWPDIDFDEGTMSIQRGMVEIKGKAEIQEPKTARGRRKIHLTDASRAALLEHRKQSVVEGNAASPWVFCDRNGSLLRKSNVRRRSFARILKSVNVQAVKDAEKKGAEPDLLPTIRFHDLRHTAATIMLRLGVHPKVAAERLGHDVMTLMQTYSHVLPSMHEEVARMLSKAAGA